MNSRLRLCLVFLAAGLFFSIPKRSPADEVIGEGKSANLPSFLNRKAKPYAYLPTDPIFWIAAEKKIRENNPLLSLQMASEQELKFASQSAEAQEARLAEAVALKELGFSHAAFTLFIGILNVRGGTGIGEAALYYIDQLALQIPIDDKRFADLVVESEFPQVHPDIQSFLGYHKGLHHLKFGFNKWAATQIAAIQPESPWHAVMDYWTAIGEVARGRVDKAFSMLSDLIKDNKLPPRYAGLGKLQMARMLFEKGQFEDAENLYVQVNDLGQREHGRILLERAWTAFYLKEFSRSLGLLRALRNKVFDSSITPERYVLEMLIDRELCHFEAVNRVARTFAKTFKKSLTVIRERKVLHEDRVLFSMAVLNRDIQERANLVDELRKESERFQHAGFQRFTFYEEVLADFQRSDQLLRAELEPQLEKFARKAAENLLDSQEQIQFLQYTSKLDALRIVKAEEERNYRSEKVRTTNFSKLFWPVDKELWLDEIDDYRVLISSRCGIQTTPEDLNLERKFR
jgi:hypothetical protein